jgi:tRNA threonylcarbamoyladenosine biosynthesis protein TsaE
MGVRRGNAPRNEVIHSCHCRGKKFDSFTPAVFFCLSMYNADMEVISNSLDDTKELAHKFARGLSPSEGGATIIGLSGELGSGKTSFVKFVAEELGVKDTITSPTFVIEKIYKLKGQLFDYLIHIDAYRLENGDELKHLGWDSIATERNNLIFLEWPEHVQGIFPKSTKMIIFEHRDKNTRLIKTS